MRKNAKNIHDICQTQVEELLRNISVDFFVMLPKYKHYVDRGFQTDDLTLSEILSIAECYALNGPDVGKIHNTLDISFLLSVVAFRLKKANPDTAEKAREVIRELVCFEQCEESPFKAKHPIAKCHCPEAPDSIGQDKIDGKTMTFLKDGKAIETKISNMEHATIRQESDKPHYLGKFE